MTSKNKNTYTNTNFHHRVLPFHDNVNPQAADVFRFVSCFSLIRTQFSVQITLIIWSFIFGRFWRCYAAKMGIIGFQQWCVWLASDFCHFVTDVGGVQTLQRLRKKYVIKLAGFYSQCCRLQNYFHDVTANYCSFLEINLKHIFTLVLCEILLWCFF